MAGGDWLANLSVASKSGDISLLEDATRALTANSGLVGVERYLEAVEEHVTGGLPAGGAEKSACFTLARLAAAMITGDAEEAGVWRRVLEKHMSGGMNLVFI